MGEQRERADLAMRTRIGQAVILHRGGDREEARKRLGQLWTELDQGGSPLHRTTVAHYLAQTQDEPEAGLAWDLRALAEADTLLGGRAESDSGETSGRAPVARACVDAEQTSGEGESLAVRSFYPRLHLSLAGAYARLGEVAAARCELVRTRSALDALGMDQHGADLFAAADRLERRLAARGREG